jgi:hypothetical protein
MYSNINKMVKPLRESIKFGLKEVCEYRYKKILNLHVDTFWTCVEEDMIDSFDDSLEFYSLEDIERCFIDVIGIIVEDNDDYSSTEYCKCSEDGDIYPFASIQQIADLFADFLTYHYVQEDLKD